MTLETSEMKDTKRCISIGMCVDTNLHGIRAIITNINQASFKELNLKLKSTMHYKFVTLFL